MGFRGVYPRHDRAPNKFRGLPSEGERFRKVVGKNVSLATLTGRAEIRLCPSPQAKESHRVNPRRNGPFAAPARG